MFSKKFWMLTVERAIKTFAQSLLAVLGVGTFTVIDAPWAAALSLAGMAALLSVLTSITSAQVGSHDDPTLLPTPQQPTGPATAV